MDCNQVFMILTRGPFPTGEPWDEEVEEHLETCGGCWRLAEALRPALEVFQESVPPAESRDLPGYWGDARPTESLGPQLLGHSASHGTMAAVRRMTRTYPSYPHYPLAAGFSPEVLRAVVFASTLTTAVLGLGLLWWFW